MIILIPKFTRFLEQISKCFLVNSSSIDTILIFIFTVTYIMHIFIFYYIYYLYTIYI